MAPELYSLALVDIQDHLVLAFAAVDLQIFRHRVRQNFHQPLISSAKRASYPSACLCNDCISFYISFQYFLAPFLRLSVNIP